MIALQQVVSSPTVELSFTELIIIVCAVLGIILFFKVWNACDDIKDIKRSAARLANAAEQKAKAKTE